MWDILPDNWLGLFKTQYLFKRVMEGRWWVLPEEGICALKLMLSIHLPGVKVLVEVPAPEPHTAEFLDVFGRRDNMKTK